MKEVLSRNGGTAMKKQSKLINLYNELFRGVGSI